MWNRGDLYTVQKIRKLFVYTVAVIAFFMMWKGQKQMISAQGRGEDPEIVLKPVKNENQKGGITYYDCGVYGIIPIEKDCYDSETMQLVAIPKDSVAKNSLCQSENEGNLGEYLIPGWEAEEKESCYEVNFRFQEDGKWEFCIQCESGREYHSNEFVIDTKEPVLAMKYGNVSGIHEECRNVANVNKIIKTNLKTVTSSECEVYTQKRGIITIEVIENNFLSDDAVIKLYRIDYEKDIREDVTDACIDGKVSWKQKDNKYILTVSLEQEGHYRIQMDYRDPAGRRMTGQSTAERSCMEEGYYRGPVYTIDQTEPIIEQILYRNEPEKKELDRSYFVQEPVMIVQVMEENFNQADFSLQDKIFDADGTVISPSLSEKDYTLRWTSRYVDGRRMNETILTVKMQANHMFAIQAADGSGWMSESGEEEVTYDKEPPEIHYRADCLQEGDIVFKPDNIWFIPYRFYRYFSQRKIRFSVTARDAVSGIREIQCYFTDEKGNRVWNSVERAENERKDVKTEELGEFQGEFVMDWDDFKGNFHVIAKDYCGIQSQEIQGKGMISESGQLHEKVNRLEITVPEASYTDEKRKIKYYKQPFDIKIFGEDSYSGIKELKVFAREEKERNSEKRRFAVVRKDYSGQEDVTYVGEKSMNINQRLFPEACRENPMEIEAVLTDNAGHVSRKKYEDYKVVIDCEKPEVSVEYDDYHARNEKYYNRTRIALVTVRDWNFNPASVQWHISGSNHKYNIGKWTDDGELHQCKIIFDQDGENYKIKFTVADYAGNRIQWDEDQKFTIDKTPPLMELKMNREGLQNGKYFSSPKNVFLTVKDRNFTEKDVKIRIKAKKDEKNLPVEGTVERTGKMTEYIRYDVKLSFQKDGDYRVSCRCKDLAGNVSEIVRIPEFTLDRTRPRLRLDGIKQGMAYSRKIAPAVSCTDRNLNEKTFRAEIYRIDGFQGKTLIYTKKRMKENKEKRIQVQWEDFPHQRWADGIYVLKVSGEDYAGNRIMMKKGIPFYVNRFGAIYSLEKSTGEIIEKTYLRQEEDIVLREISVNDTDTHISVWKDNQERKDLSAECEGGQQPDYLIKNVDTSKYIKGKRGWYEKEYCILKENFAREGVYQVTVYSVGYVFQNGRKEEIKETTNELQRQSVRFTVDKTPPVVQISGLEKKIYKEKRHAIIITSMDNYALDHMEIRIHYENGGKEDDIYQFTSKDFGADHSLELVLENYAGQQTVSYKAWDRAGNCSDSSQTGKNISCVITDQKKTPSYDKKNPFFGAAALCFLAGGLAAIIWQSLKKKKSHI